MSNPDQLLIAISASPQNRGAGLRCEDEILALGFDAVVETEFILEPDAYPPNIEGVNIYRYAKWIGGALKDPEVQADHFDVVSRADIVVGMNSRTLQGIINYIDPLTQFHLMLAGQLGKLPVLSHEYSRCLGWTTARRLGLADFQGDNSVYPFEDPVRDAYLNAVGTRRALGDMKNLPRLLQEHRERRRVKKGEGVMQITGGAEASR